MFLCRRAVGPLALGLVLLTAGTAPADRVVSQKAVTIRSPGVRGDITVPYLTTGYSTLGVWQRVSPYIYSAPEVYETYSVNLPAAYDRHEWQPVYNPYYYSTLLGYQSRWTGKFYTPFDVGYASRAYYTGARPVFNLQFYGATLGFSSRSTGAVYRPWPLPIPQP
jgi:hypothetical protein